MDLRRFLLILFVAFAALQGLGLSHTDSNPSRAEISADHCAICEGLAVLGAGNVPAPLPVHVIGAAVMLNVEEYAGFIPQVLKFRPDSRGPPAAA